MIKKMIMSHLTQYRLRGQFSSCIDVLSIAPELKPDIIIVQEDMYFVGLRDFVRILTERGVQAVYILLKSESVDLTEYKNSCICARLDEERLTEELLFDAFRLAEEKLRDQADNRSMRSVYENQDHYFQMEENRFFARIIGGQMLESDHQSPIIQCQEGYLIIIRLSFLQNKSYHSCRYMDEMEHLNQMMKLYLEIYGGGNVFSIQLNEICIWFDPGTDSEPHIKQIIRQIRCQVQKEDQQCNGSGCVLQHTDRKVTLSELPAQYRSLDKLVRYHFFVEPDVMISEDYLQKNTVKISYQEIQERFDVLESSYEEFDRDEFFYSVDRLFQLAAQALSYNTYFYIWNQLIFWYNLKVKENQLPIDEYAFTLDMNTFSSIQEAKSEVKQMFQRLFDAAVQEKSFCNSYVEKAISYLRDNISENISLTAAADFLHINSAYLSSLFRQETQKTFVQIRSEIKVDRAKELLKEKRKIYEVSQAVGFENEKYFGQAFKKITGMTPREYQSREGEHEKH